MNSVKFGQLECGKEELGRGALGIAYKGFFQDKPVAVKKVLVDRLSSNSMRGIYPMNDLDHPNVLKVIHIQDFSLHRMFAMELCAGTLDDYSKSKYQGPMPEELSALLQMAQGVRHIHEHNLIHKELKPSNVLIHLSNEPILKISDFGLAKTPTHRGTFTCSAIKGTHNYLAPELLAHLADDSDRMFPAETPLVDPTPAADTFALGCIFYFYLTRGCHPFGTGLLVATSILTGYSDLSGLNSDHFAKPIIGRMIHDKAMERPSMSQIVELIEESEYSTDL